MEPRPPGPPPPPAPARRQGSNLRDHHRRPGNERTPRPLGGPGGGCNIRPLVEIGPAERGDGSEESTEADHDHDCEVGDADALADLVVADRPVAERQVPSGADLGDGGGEGAEEIGGGARPVPMPRAVPRRPVAAPTAMVIRPKPSPISVRVAAMATASPGRTVSWKPRPAMTQAVPAEASRRACRAIAQAFWNTIARRRMGRAAMRASVPSSSPILAPAQVPGRSKTHRSLTVGCREVRRGRIGFSGGGAIGTAGGPSLCQVVRLSMRTGVDAGGVIRLRVRR